MYLTAELRLLKAMEAWSSESGLGRGLRLSGTGPLEKFSADKFPRIYTCATSPFALGTAFTSIINSFIHI